MEVFLDMKEYPNKVRVSNYGNIQVFTKRGWIKKAHRKTTNGYRKFSQKTKTNDIWINKHYLVHREVAKLFILNPYNKPLVNHKNGNKEDNNISNLEWCTPSENTIHAIGNNLQKDISGEGNFKNIVTEHQVKEIYYKSKFLKIPTKLLCVEYNLSKSGICSIVSKKNWKKLWTKYPI